MSIHYDSRKLLQYEWSDRADHAKKILEKRCIAELVRELVVRDGSPLRSLDIGSATGRYPLWFNELGFEAVGYDISPEAVAMSRLSARGRSGIEFHLRVFALDDYLARLLRPSNAQMFVTGLRRPVRDEP